MNMEDFCEHTFVRWVEQVATCAVCQKKFPDTPYLPGFMGTFPRDRVEQRRDVLATTMNYIPPIRYTLEEE